MNRICTVGAALASMTIAAPSFGEEIELKTGLTKGRELTYDIVQSMTVEQRSSPEGDAVTFKSDVTATVVLSVVDVNDAGGARVACTFKSFSTRFEDPSGPTSITYDMKIDENATGLAALEEPLAGTTVMFNVNPSGRASGFAGMDGLFAALSESEEATPELFGFFRPNMMGDLFSQMFSADGGIGAHEMGDTWSDMRRVSTGSAGAIEITTSSTLGIAQAEFAAITGTVTFEMYVPRERNEGVATISLGQSSGQVLTRWDTANGAAIFRTMNHEVNIDGSLGDLRTVQFQRASTKIERK